MPLLSEIRIRDPFILPDPATQRDYLIAYVPVH